jgi:ferredoxin
MDPAPALYFKESLCVQCDLCRAGCPEKAITLQARFLPDAALRIALRELANDQFVSCSSCGTPFIGRRKLAASLTLMKEHAEDLPGGIDSLRMCQACRQRETMRG